MIGLFHRIGLPLLTKELIEQASRKRTYVIRTFYALIVSLVGFSAYSSVMSNADGSFFRTLGEGRVLFTGTLYVQFFVIYVIMPALMCSAITGEKERNSLSLLMLTRLGPTTILLEKFMGRMIPMVMSMVLLLPITAMAYSLGGVTTNDMVLGVILLLVATFQVGSLAILCSAYARTTVGSFVSCYLLGVPYLFGPILVHGLSGGQFWNGMNSLLLAAWGVSYEVFGPEMFLVPVFNWGMMAGLGGTVSWIALLLRLIPVAVTSCLSLLLARYYLRRRAFLEPKNTLLLLFRRLDTFFKRINNNRITRGIEVIKESTFLPIGEPVAWRETQKSVLGAFRYLVRLLVFLELPVFAICVFIIAVEGGIEPLGVVTVGVWIIGTLIISVKASGLFNTERSKETLDVLLTTPMTGRQLVREKMTGLWRLVGVVMIPLITGAAFKVWWMFGTSSPRRFYRPHDSWGVYCIGFVLSVIVYLPLVAWVSLWCGLIVRHQIKAMFTALGVLLAWCVVPFLALFAVVLAFGPASFAPDDSATVFFLMASPASFIGFNETHTLSHLAFPPPVIIALNFVGYSLVLYRVRRLCLTSADRYLQRLQSVDETDRTRVWDDVAPHGAAARSTE